MIVPYSNALHCEVLQTVITSSSCPEPVLRLCAAAILRLWPTARPLNLKNVVFDTSVIREKALQSLALPNQSKVLGLRRIAVCMTS